MVASLSTVEASTLSASVEAEWMRDQEESPKTLISRRRGGLLKQEKQFLLTLERTTSSAARAIFSVPQPLLLSRGGESPAKVPQKYECVEASELSASVEAQTRRSVQAPKQFFFLILNGTTSSAALWWLPRHFFLVPQPLLLSRGGESPPKNPQKLRYFR